MTDAEATGKGAVHSYQVDYPSGNRMVLNGVFLVMGRPGESPNPVVRVEKDMHILDPRAVVSRDGLIVHEPRKWKVHSSWVLDWLRAHPEWPQIVTEVEPS